jgi:hypothetical protein
MPIAQSECKRRYKTNHELMAENNLDCQVIIARPDDSFPIRIASSDGGIEPDRVMC